MGRWVSLFWGGSSLLLVVFLGEAKGKECHLGGIQKKRRHVQALLAFCQVKKGPGMNTASLPVKGTPQFASGSSRKVVA